MRNSSAELNTLSRRYELPTCLLEVWTERSPLSDWQAQTVAKNLRFKLRLAHSGKIIKGNQQQIVSLIDAVTIYCDRWLAQDSFDSLDHAINVPKLSKLQLSTLQLFDLYESLELCANEFVILPNLLLEVRRFNPNWLKIVAAAIAIVGVSIGTIRLVSREQPSFQIASTPSAEVPDKAPTSPPVSSESKSAAESSAKIAASPKSTNQITPPKPNDKSIPSSSSQGINRETQSRERLDKVAIAPESSAPLGNLNSNQVRPIDKPPAMADGAAPAKSPNSPVAQPRRIESEEKDTYLSGRATSETSKPSVSAPAKILPSIAESRAEEAVVPTSTKIKVLEIQTNLPSEISTSLIEYIQRQSITTSATGTLSLDLDISGDRIRNLLTNASSSTLKDGKAISELQDFILRWRSPNNVTGKVRLVLQL